MQLENYPKLSRKEAKEIVKMIKEYGFKGVRSGYQLHYRELKAYANGYEIEELWRDSPWGTFSSIKSPSFQTDRFYRVVLELD